MDCHLCKSKNLAKPQRKACIRISRCLQWSGKRRKEKRRCSQNGGGQGKHTPISADGEVDSAGGKIVKERATTRKDPKHRNNGPYRCRKTKPRPNAYFFYTGKITNSEVLMKERLQWTGWTKRRRGHHYHFCSYHSVLEGSSHKTTLLIRPRHVDFTVEVERSLRYLMGHVAVFDARSRCRTTVGETVWRQADKVSCS